MIITAVLQTRVTHLLLFSLGRRSKFSYGVCDAFERNRAALVLPKQADEPTSLSCGANALSTGLLSKGRVRNAAERGCQWNGPGFRYLNPVQTQRLRRAVSASLRLGGFGRVPKLRSCFFFLNAPMTILRSGELCDQLLRGLIAKETTKGLGIFCYLASLFGSGSVAVSGLG